MKRLPLMLVMSVLVIASMVLAACQPAAPTGEVTEPPSQGETQPPGEATQPPAAETQPPAPPSGAGVERAPLLRYGVLEDMTSTNVWALFDEADASAWNYYVQSWQWPVLYELSDQRFQVVPSVAEGFPTEFEQEGEFFVSTVALKDGLVWSDGSPLTAEDVAFTANTVLKFRLGLNWLSYYNPTYLSHVEAVDPTHVKFYWYAEPGLALWQYGTLTGIFVSKAYWEPRIAEAWNLIADIDTGAPENADILAEAVDILQGLDNEGEPVGGQFQLVEWEPGAFSETAANDNYPLAGATVREFENGAYQRVKEGVFDETVLGEPEGPVVLEYVQGPHFDSVLYSLYASQDAGVLALRADEIDFLLTANGIQQGFVPQLESDPNIEIVTTPNNGFRYLGFNHNRADLSNITFKQALACMIDLDFISQNVLQGQTLPVYTLVPEGNTDWHNPDVPKYCVGMDAGQRVNASVQMLKDAGFTWTGREPSWDGEAVIYGEGLTLPDGTPFAPVEILAPSAAYDPLRATSAVYIEQWFRELGVDATANLTNFNNILAAVYETGEYDAFILGWGLTIFPDYLCTFFDQDLGNPYNYVSEDLAALCETFLAETDIEAAKQQAFEIQNLLATELPYITLFTTPVVDAYRTTIQFPYTDVLGGIGPYLYGLPDKVRAQ